MRTTRTILGFIGLLVVSAAPALAQPTPGRLAPAEEAATRAEIKRLELEHVRYDLRATPFDGIWALSGERAVGPQKTRFSGELTLVRDAEGKFKITGKVVLEGRTAGKWEGTGAVTSDGALEGPYKATIAGEGTMRLAVGEGGALRLTFRTTSEPRTAGEAAATRAITLSRADLEKRLFELNAKLQAHRYGRPTPQRYRTPSRKTEVRFTPTVEWDPDGVEAQVIKAIDEARASVDLAVFEFSLPRVAEALVRAQARGVKVRMVYDNREEEQPALKLLKDAQVPVRSDARSAYMHNKFMIVDKRFLWTGSTNLAPGGIYVADNNAISFRNEALCAEYQKEFDEMFVDGKFGVTSPANTSREWLLVDTGVKLQVRFAPEDECMTRLLEAVKGARRSVKFMAFAFTSKALHEALLERMQAGVVVEGIFESRHAGWADIKIGPLHAAGAKVRFDENPNAMHHKVIVVDDKLVCTGSFNFSDGADRENDENLLVIDNVAIARAYAKEFRAIFDTCDPNDPRIATSGMGGGTGTNANTDGEDERGMTDAVTPNQ